MNSKRRKSLCGQLRKLPRGKLLALAVQKGEMSLITAREFTDQELANQLSHIEGVLSPKRV